MRINRYTPASNPARAVIWSERENTPWMVVNRTVSEDGRTAIFSGALAESSGGTVPVVRPVRVELPAQEGEISELNDIACKLMFAHASGLRAVVETDDSFDMSAFNDDAWAAFTGANISSAGSARKKVALDPAEFDWLRRARLGVSTPGSEEVRLNTAGSRLRIGSPMDALKGARAALSVGPGLGATPLGEGMDLDRAQKSLAAVARPSAHMVEYYGRTPSTMTPEEGENLMLRRRQAAEAFPVLAGWIANSPRISRIVDSGQSLQSEMAERTGMTKGAFKRLRNVTEGIVPEPLFASRADTHGEDALGVDRTRRHVATGVASLDEALSVLSKMPPDRTPSSNEEWRAFTDILGGLAIPVRDTLGLDPVKTLSAVKRSWCDYRDSLARAADIPEGEMTRRRLTLSTLDSLDAIDMLSRNVVIPLSLASVRDIRPAAGSPEITADTILDAFAAASEAALGKSKNIGGSLMEMSRRYASRVPALMGIAGNDFQSDPDRDLATRHGESGFPLLVNGLRREEGGRRLRQLENKEDMTLESAALRHCVSTHYVRPAIEGDVHLFSISDMDGNRLSTLEVSKARTDKNGNLHDDAAFRRIEHTSYKNGDPSAECTRIAANFIRDLNEGIYEINAAELHAWREMRKRQRETSEGGIVRNTVSWKSVCGFDEADAERRNAYWREWKDIAGLPDANDPGVLFRSAKMRGLVEKMDPLAAELMRERAAAPRPDPAPDAPSP